VQASLQTLRVFGVSPEDIAQAEQQDQAIRPELVMRSPLAGTVVQKLVLPGQFIQAGATAAFVISNTATVWVQGHIYDKDLTTVHVGDAVDERNASFPQTFHGVVSYIGDLLDPATRTTPVRIVTQNVDGLLKKDLFVDIVIHGKTTRSVRVVPTAAVLYDDQNLPFVYVQVAPGRFAQRTVTLGGQQDDVTEIVTGVADGDTVVSQGSVFLQFANTYQGAAS
jgi:cobalt-zinc-cadmium efflux system membrane fusion protein